MREMILSFIDFFYPPFRRVMPLQTFRYAACGGMNTALDIFLFFIFYNFLFQKEVVYLGIATLKPHIAAFAAAFVITFPLGFYLSRYVVFSESNIRGRVQLARYFFMVMLCIALNYFSLKLLVEHIGFYPTVAKMITTVIVVAFSYLGQKHFTFKTVPVKGV